MKQTIKIFIAAIFVFMLTSCGKTYEITYIVDGEVYNYEQNTFSKKENFVLPRVEHSSKGFTFDGWYETEDFTGESHLTTRNLPKRNVTLYVKWKINDREIDLKLKPYETATLQQSLDLPKQLNNFTITYESSNLDVLSNDGILTRDYEPTSLLFTVTYKDKDSDYTYQKTYPINIAGYKPLDDFIRSSYVYRTDGYKLIDQNFSDSLDIVYAAFSLADENGIVGPEYSYYTNLEYLLPIAKENGLWVIMSVGPSSKWSSFSKTKELREQFANSVVEIINRFGFDGVDIDWETPTVNESDNYVKLLKVVHEKVKQNNPKHLVTTAITAGPLQPPKFNLISSGQYLDYINLMAYDLDSLNGHYQNPLYDSQKYHNSLASVGKTLTGYSIDKTIPLLNSYGIPNSKIVIGIAFYGVKQVKKEGSWVKEPSIPYHEVLKLIQSGDYTQHFDETTKVPYLLKKDYSVFISFDNRTSILAKGQYVIDNKLGGMMYWEHSDDNTGLLLKAINEALRPN